MGFEKRAKNRQKLHCVKPKSQQETENRGRARDLERAEVVDRINVFLAIEAEVTLASSEAVSRLRGYRGLD